MEYLPRTDKCETKSKSPGGAPCCTYRPAVEAEELVRQVIDSYHPHLKEAKIIYLFRSGKWRVRNRTVRGKALIASQPWRYICGNDLVLILNEPLYLSASAEGKLALIDHELSHFNPPVFDKNGDPVWTLRDHDVREFSDVVKRHNICMSNLLACADDGMVQLNMMQSLSDTIEDTEALGKIYNDVVEIDDEENYFMEDFDDYQL